MNNVRPGHGGKSNMEPIAQGNGNTYKVPHAIKARAARETQHFKVQRGQGTRQTIH